MGMESSPQKGAWGVVVLEFICPETCSSGLEVGGGGSLVPRLSLIVSTLVIILVVDIGSSMGGIGGGAASLVAIVPKGLSHTPFQALWGHRKPPLSIVMDLCLYRG